MAIAQLRYTMFETLKESGDRYADKGKTVFRFR